MSGESAKDKRAGMLARIRALMARTVKNGCTEAEAREAARKVDVLMGQYEIDLDELTVKEMAIVQLRVAARDHDVIESALAIARFCDCMCWYSGKDIVYHGFQVDTEIAEYLTMLFMRAIDREGTQFPMFNQDYAEAGPRGQRIMMHSFRVGMAVRLGERLGELKSKRDFSRKTTGRDLVAIKTPLVQAAFEALGLTLGAGRSRGGSYDTGAYNAGRAAGDGVALSQGIAGRAAQGGRLK